MSESRIECPLCHRAPGAQHLPVCPRSREAKRALNRKPQHRVSYMSKGVDISERNGEPVLVRNPGFPRVSAPGKPWTAGGLPLGFDRESALEFMKTEAIKPLSDYTTPKQETTDDAQRQEPATQGEGAPDQRPSEPHEDGLGASAAPREE